MRAFVFGEAQIDPALQRWFGSQQLSTEQELEFTARLMAFLTSAEASALRYTNHDPKPEVVRGADVDCRGAKEREPRA